MIKKCPRCLGGCMVSRDGWWLCLNCGHELEGRAHTLEETLGHSAASTGGWAAGQVLDPYYSAISRELAAERLQEEALATAKPLAEEAEKLRPFTHWRRRAGKK